MYVNNFRFVDSYPFAPPHLTFVEEFENYVLYHSGFNDLVYVAFDQNTEIYHSFENNGESEDVINDLRIAIGVILGQN